MSSPNNITTNPENSIDATTSATGELEVDDELPTPVCPYSYVVYTYSFYLGGAMEKLQVDDELPTKASLAKQASVSLHS